MKPYPAAVLLVCSISACGSSPEGFEPLWNERDLSGLTLVGIDSSALSVEGGILRCSGSPNGYWYPAGIFRNFTLWLEFRFVRPPGLSPGADDTFTGNSGYFVYITPPHQVWPRGLEVQGMNSDIGRVLSLPDTAVPVGQRLDELARAGARRPVGDWNQLEIISGEGALRVWLNGVLINQSEPADLREGFIGFQSEGAPIDWRNLLIRRAR